MSAQQLLDPLPIAVILLAFALAAWLLFETGYRIGRWWQEKTPEETEGPTDMLVGSLLALLAFLLAVTMGMASDRFDARRNLVREEANAIGTTYLRAGFLPEPERTEARDLLREYTPLRIGTTDTRLRATNIQRSLEIQDELWAQTEALAAANADSETFALYVETLNETIDLHATRVTAVVYGRVPETVVILLFGGALLTLGMVGYSAGLTRRRSPLTATVLIVVLGAVLVLVLDLDRPQDGFLQVSQQPLLELQEQIGPPSSP
jgi:hypothetical protein